MEKLGDSRSIDSAEASGTISEEDPFVCPLVERVSGCSFLN